MNAMAWTWVTMAVGVGLYGWIWKRAGKRGRAWLEWGLFLAVAGASAASVAMHEPWRDELHTWLQARDMTLGQLWEEMAFEGHFLPWHLVLHPFARLGAPVEAMGWISWAINAATVAWFARKAPLGGWAKAAVALSCLFLFVNPVVSRCYVLVPPVLFGLAVLWGRRDEHPVLFGVLAALLANTHLAMEGTVAAVFLVYAWQNVLGRKDGKGGRQCGRQWAGLGIMAAGVALALAQVLPSLWKSSVTPGNHAGWTTSLGYFGMECIPWFGGVAAVAGLAWLGVEAWLRDRGVFTVFAGSLAYMAVFSVCVYPAHVVNRALLWWPVALAVAWAMGERVAGGSWRGRWLTAAVAVTGLGLMRPDMIWHDWKAEYDTLPGACRFIAERYGRDAETWINGGDKCTEVASAYLDNVLDWRTGARAERMRLSAGAEKQECPFRDFLDGYFESRPEAEGVRVLGSFSQWCGLTKEDMTQAGVEVEYLARQAVGMWSVPVVVMTVWRGKLMEPAAFWMWAGNERFGRGDRAGAAEAWARAVQADGEQWMAMNNLAWLCAEEGRVVEARAWMDRAMANEDARNNAGVWDTEAAVRRAEGNEDDAREAERRRDGLKNAE